MEKSMKKVKGAYYAKPVRVKNARIHFLIDKFLEKKTPCSRGGGWAPVTQEELEQFYEIIGKLVETKYQADADGDHPIEYILIDRNGFEGLPFRPMPYAPRAAKATTSEDVLQEAWRFETAQLNVELAMEQFRNAIRPVREFIKEFAESAVEMEQKHQTESGDPVDRLGV
jgi:hypothetical protein